jgi:uncharacterized protein YciI
VLREGCGPASRSGRRGRSRPWQGDRAHEVAGYPFAVADYYLVERGKGPAWDHSRPRREQAGWDEHAAFMDALVDEGFVVLGGPIGDGDGENTLLVIDGEDEAQVRGRLAEDPWPQDLLTIESVRPWSVWLRGTTDAR